jgi:inorganic pyrophosphatase
MGLQWEDGQAEKGCSLPPCRKRRIVAMRNLWRELPSGPQPPEVVYVIVEIPRGSRNKYEYQEAMGIIKMDRLLYSSLHYPGDYGLVPQTLAEDNDPLDVLIIVTQPTFPGCVVEARPLGLFRMLDRDQADDKVLAVPASDPLYNEYHDLDDVPPHFLREVAHFFTVYKDLEGVRVKPIGWESRPKALEAIEQAMASYRREFG